MLRSMQVARVTWRNAQPTITKIELKKFQKILVQSARNSSRSLANANSLCGGKHLLSC